MEYIDILTKKQLFKKYNEYYIANKFYICNRTNFADNLICFCYIKHWNLVGLTELEFSQDNLFILNTICVDENFRNQKIATNLLIHIIDYSYAHNLMLMITKYTYEGNLYIKPLFERLMKEYTKNK